MITMTSQAKGVHVQNVELSIPDDPDWERPPWRLAFEDKEGNRYHTWVEPDTLQLMRGQVVYKKPPLKIEPLLWIDTPHGKKADPNPAYFGTRELRSDSRAMEDRLHEARYFIAVDDLVAKAKAAVKGSLDRQALDRQVKEIEASNRRRLTDNALALRQALQRVARILESLEEEEEFSFTSLDEIRVLLRLTEQEQLPEREPAVALVVDNEVPF